MPVISWMRACHLLLNIASHFADIDFFFYDDENIGHHDVFMDRDLYAIIRAASEETIQLLPQPAPFH